MITLFVLSACIWCKFVIVERESETVQSIINSKHWSWLLITVFVLTEKFDNVERENTTQQLIIDCELNHNLINCYKLKVCETLTNCISATSCWKHCSTNFGANYLMFNTVLDPNHNLSVCVQFTYVENLSARSCWKYCSANIGVNYWSHCLY